MRYQFREWLKATVIFSLAICCLWGFAQTFITPPRVIYGQGGVKVDARPYCIQAGERVIEGLDPADPMFIEVTRGRALSACFSEAAIDTPLLILQVLVSAGMALAFWFLLMRL